MAEFFLEKTQTEPEKHHIHRKYCEELANKEDARYLGSFGQVSSAYSKAIGLYHGVEYCPYCLGK